MPNKRRGNPQNLLPLNTSERTRQMWQDPEYRRKVLEGVRRSWKTNKRRQNQKISLRMLQGQRMLEAQIRREIRQQELNDKKEQRIKRILDAYRSGMLIADIAESIPITQGTLFRLLRKLDEPKRCPPHSENIRQEVLRLSDQGCGIKEIAVETKVSERTVSTWRNEARRNRVELEQIT